MGHPTGAYARVRVRKDQAEFLYGVLFQERGRLIGLKIAEREAGEDPADLRQELVIVKYLMEETRRAIDDIDEATAPRTVETRPGDFLHSN